MGSHNTRSEIVVRSAREQDREAVVELFDEAFSSKFAHAVKEQSLRRRFWSSIIQISQVTVAERGGHVLGMALLSYTAKPGFASVTFADLVNLLGLVKAVRATVVFLLFRRLDWKPSPHHAYLEAISVSSSARGSGVGSLVLAHLNDIVHEAGLQGLELSVVFENPDARRLYEKQGFHLIQEKKSPLLHLFTGVAGACVMRRPL